MGGANRGLSDRRVTELRRLVVGVVFVAVVTPRVALTMDAAWRADGLGRSLALALPNTLPLVNEAVLLPVGLVGTWLALFCLDRSKRLQTVVALLAAAVFVVVVVVVEQQWLEAVDLGSDWPALVVGGSLGLLSGAVPQLRSDARSREFPVAAGALFAVVILLGAVSLLDLYLLGDPVSVEGWLVPGIVPGPPPGSALGAPVDVFAVAVFTLVIGTLVLYVDAREIAVVAGDGRDAMTLVAALLDETDPDYQGSVTTGNATAVLDAQGAIGEGNRPHPLPGTTAVSFLPPRQFSRWVTATVERHDPGRIDGGTVESARQSGSVGLLRRLIPRRVRRALRPDAVLAATELVRADIVLFVVSMDAFDTSGDPDEVGEPEYLSQYRELSRKLGSRSKQITVLLSAGEALPIYRADTGVADADLDTPAFRDWLGTDLLNIPRATVVPMDRTAAEGRALLANTDELRERLQR